MKIIGLLGGASWLSTPQYYTYLNQKISEALGGDHSAKIILYSVDYQPLKAAYEQGWDEVSDILEQEIKTLDEMGPDCIIICNNTLHKAYDMVVESQRAMYQGQVIHAAVATAQKAQQEEYQRVLLLGTPRLMADGFFAERFKFFGVQAEVPSVTHQADIGHILEQVGQGGDPAAQFAALKEVIRHYEGYDAVVPACGELSMLLSDETVAGMPILNPVHAQCDAALKMVLSDLSASS